MEGGLLDILLRRRFIPPYAPSIGGRDESRCETILPRMSGVCIQERTRESSAASTSADTCCGPFHVVGVDVLQLPPSYQGNQYAIVFMDYLTKWPEVFATCDQKAETIGRLLVEQVSHDMGYRNYCSQTGT